MKKSTYILVFLSVFFIASCSDSPFTPRAEKNPPTGQKHIFGLVEVTISGIGTDNITATARPAAMNAAFNFTRPNGSGGANEGTIQLQAVSNSSLTYGVRGSGGMRYVYAVFKVRNADVDGNPYPSALQNLTFLAVDTEASPGVQETYGETAISALRLFNGDPLVNATQLAGKIIPTGKVEIDASGGLVSSYADVTQVFTEDEVQDIEDNILPTGSDVHDIFPYGFVVRTPNVTPGSRELPISTDTDDFAGIVTFAFKMPLQAQANQDPFEITIMFLAVDDSETRITRSKEEGLYDGTTAFEQRIAELSASTVTLLGKTITDGPGPVRTLCDARVSGTKNIPISTLTTCSNDLLHYYVDADAIPGSDGSSWANAFTDLQNALAAAHSGDVIWVADGTYYPDEGTGQTDGDRTATFQLKSGVEIYGGFDPGTGADTFVERDFAANVTTLSGDLAQNDATGNSTENAYHVVTGSGTDNTAVLNGFTITAGRAVSPDPNNKGGGGMNNDAGSPTLTNLIFTSNRAIFGGGMANTNSSPTLTNVTFNNNYTGLYGAGMANTNASNPTLTNVVFSNNTADDGGGGMVNINSSPLLTNVIFTGNRAGFGNGGGMDNKIGSSPTLINVIFISNRTSNGSAGGGMSNSNGSNATLNHVTFSGNIAGSGGGMVNGNNSNPTLTNVIIWGNQVSFGPASIENNNSTPNISFSLIASSGGSSSWDTAFGTDGGNNIDADPLFIDAANGDYSLQSTSPAIDAGDNSLLPLDLFDLDGDGDIGEPLPLDLAGNPRVVDGDGNATATVDQGAYEVQ